MKNTPKKKSKKKARKPSLRAQLRCAKSDVSGLTNTLYVERERWRNFRIENLEANKVLRSDLKQAFASNRDLITDLYDQRIETNQAFDAATVFAYMIIPVGSLELIMTAFEHTAKKLDMSRETKKAATKAMKRAYASYVSDEWPSDSADKESSSRDKTIYKLIRVLEKAVNEPSSRDGLMDELLSVLKKVVKRDDTQDAG